MLKSAGAICERAAAEDDLPVGILALVGPADFDDDNDDAEPDTYGPLPPAAARAWRHPAEAAAPASSRRVVWRAPAVLLVGSLIVGVAATSAVWFTFVPADTTQSARPLDHVAVLADRTPRIDTATVAQVPLLRVERSGSAATIAALAVRDGVLATAADLVVGSSRLTLASDDREVGILAIDSTTNIVLLSIARDGRTPSLTDSFTPAIGETLVAVAGPGTAWPSTVTAVDERPPGAANPVAFRVASSSALQRGASLLDASGRNAGVVVKVDGSDGWAVPARYLKAMAARSIDSPGSWPTVGLDVDASDAYLRVGSVDPNGPASSAGILPNDTITAVDDSRVTSALAFRTSIMEAKVGQNLRIAYVRDGDARNATLVVAPRGQSPPPASP